MRAADHGVGNSGGYAFPHDPEVFVQWLVPADTGDDGVAGGIDRIVGDVAIPSVVGRQQQSSAEVRIGAGGNRSDVRRPDAGRHQQDEGKQTHGVGRAFREAGHFLRSRRPRRNPNA